jgi:hypothetical protein
VFEVRCVVSSATQNHDAFPLRALCTLREIKDYGLKSKGKQAGKREIKRRLSGFFSLSGLFSLFS